MVYQPKVLLCRAHADDPRWRSEWVIQQRQVCKPVPTGVYGDFVGIRPVSSATGEFDSIVAVSRFIPLYHRYH